MTAVVSTDLTAAAEILQRGGLVAFPTETVYGLGANALSTEAVARVFEVKGRPHFDPLIVHLHDRKQLPEFVADWPDLARKLTDRFWPGPLTIIVPKTDLIPDLVTGGGPYVGVRMPDHPLALALLKQTGLPLAAPSANRFGRLSPTEAAAVAEQLGDRIDLILDGGPCRVGVESTVVFPTNGGLQLLRPGGITLEELEAVAGPVHVLPRQPSAARETSTGSPLADRELASSSETPPVGLLSPGTLPQHYAPRTLLSIATSLPAVPQGQRWGLLCLRRPDTLRDVEFGGTDWAVVEELSGKGDLREATSRFFAALRRLDHAGLDQIIALPLPETGLGRALNDRLQRAAVSR